MNIYRVSRTDRITWDDFDSMVVYAHNEDEARRIAPKWTNAGIEPAFILSDEDPTLWQDYCSGDWVSVEQINSLKVDYLGCNNLITEPAVIVASFNAG